MNFHSKHLIISLLFVALLPIATLASSTSFGLVNMHIDRALSPLGTDSYTENFMTTTYADIGTTTAEGWGTGTVTSPRIGAITLLDHYSTSTDVRAVEVQGRKAYIGVWQATLPNPCLVILNITDPANMAVMATRTAPAHVFDLQIEGDMLFGGADSLGGFIDGLGDTWIYNVSNPYITPPFMGGYFSMEGLPTGMDVQGHFYYLTSYKASSSHGLYIFDVEDPNNINNIPNSMIFSELLDIDVDGQLAYLADGTFGLYIVNVSNPYMPVTMGSVDTPGNATGIIVDGSLAYVADGGSGVQVIDVSNPSNPVIIGSIDTAGNARRLALQGDTLYVTDGSNGLVVLDVSDPTNPYLVDTYALAYAWDVDLYGGIVVVSASDGVYTFQIGSLDSLSFVGSYSGGYEFWDVKVRGDVAYIAAGADGLLTVDVSDPGMPVLLDSYSIGAAFYRKLDVQGHLAFVADYGGGHGVQIFDVSDPTNIQYLSTYGKTYATDVFVAGEVIYIADGTYGFYIANVSDPYNPQTITFLDLGSHNVTAVWVQGYHLYIAGEGFDDDISIYNIIDISNPTPVHTSLTGTTDQYDIFVDGDACYNVAVNPEVSVYYNVTDPYNPSWSGGVLFATAGEPRGVWGFGPYMLAANYSGGIALIEAYLNNMNVIASYSGASTAIQVTVHGDYAYVANRSSLVILRLFRSAGATYATGTSQAISVEVDTTDLVIEKATLTYNAFIFPGTTISFEMSADGGTHWEAVTPGVEHTFTNTGSDLRWRAILNTPIDDRSVHLYDVTIDYQYTEPTVPIPGFPLEAVIIGAFFALSFAVIRRRKNH